jgi:DNA-binding transcriptional MocR family regulator
MITTNLFRVIELAIQALVSPGDWVVVEGPGPMGPIELLSTLGVRVATAPVDPGGLVMDSLERLFRRFRPRILYATPTFHNPSGVNMSLERRQRLLELADAWDVTVIEDGEFNALALTEAPPPPLRALSERVVHVASFARTLMPGVGLGYIVAPSELIRCLAQLNQVIAWGDCNLFQLALTGLLVDGHYASHLRRVLPIYRRKREALLRALARHLPPPAHWSEPAGGLSLWVDLPPGVNTSALYSRAIAEGVQYAPGALHHAPGAPTNQLRLCYGAVSLDQIDRGIARLAGVIADAA